MSTAHPEVIIEQMKRQAGRDCGSCSMCCRLLRIDDPELKKPEGKWCKHCLPGKGCGIYADRPQVCRTFGCRWLLDASMPDYWFPKHSKMVVQENLSGINPILEIFVDPGFPNRWREEPYFSQIKQMALQGFKQQPPFSTGVFTGNKNYLILTHREIEPKGKLPCIFQVAEDHFECLLVELPAEGTLKMQKMTELARENKGDIALAFKIMCEGVS